MLEAPTERMLGQNGAELTHWRAPLLRGLNHALSLLKRFPLRRIVLVSCFILVMIRPHVVTRTSWICSLTW